MMTLSFPEFKFIKFLRKKKKTRTQKSWRNSEESRAKERGINTKKGGMKLSQEERKRHKMLRIE